MGGRGRGRGRGEERGGDGREGEEREEDRERERKSLTNASVKIHGVLWQHLRGQDSFWLRR